MPYRDTVTDGKRTDGAPPDGIEDQSEQRYATWDSMLTAAGASPASLVKTTIIFYANVDDFAAINAVYARCMPDPAGAVCAGQCGPAA